MSEALINHPSKSYIAILEDDESLCRSLARLLQASGYQPVTYHSAEVFLDDAKQPVFDCLIVDIQLGGMSGLELGEHLARDGSNIPLIFLMAHENWETLKQSIRTPHVAFLLKTDSGETDNMPSNHQFAISITIDKSKNITPHVPFLLKTDSGET